jgi:hypothetical protein
VGVVDVLKQARDLLAGPNQWTQYKIARNEAGLFVSPRSPGAVCWCSAGAVEKVCGFKNELFNDAIAALNSCAINQGYTSIVNFNDDVGTEQRDVLAMFDKAIKKEGQSA